MHWRPSPANPSSQLQVKEPAVFSQSASWWQSWTPFVHSSMSKSVIRKVVYIHVHNVSLLLISISIKWLSHHNFQVTSFYLFFIRRNEENTIILWGKPLWVSTYSSMSKSVIRKVVYIHVHNVSLLLISISIKWLSHHNFQVTSFYLFFIRRNEENTIILWGKPLWVSTYFLSRNRWFNNLANQEL